MSDQDPSVGDGGGVVEGGPGAGSSAGSGQQPQLPRSSILDRWSTENFLSRWSSRKNLLPSGSVESGARGGDSDGAIEEEGEEGELDEGGELSSSASRGQISGASPSLAPAQGLGGESRADDGRGGAAASALGDGGGDEDDEDDDEFEARRRRVNKDKQFARLMCQLWDVEDFQETRRDWGNRLPQSGYLPFIVMVHMLLVPPPYKVEEIMEQSLRDWESDSGDDKLLDYDEFNRSIFELVDCWTETEDPREYVEFLALLMRETCKKVVSDGDDEEEEEEEEGEEKEEEGEEDAGPTPLSSAQGPPLLKLRDKDDPQFQMRFSHIGHAINTDLGTNGRPGYHLNNTGTKLQDFGFPYEVLINMFGEEDVDEKLQTTSESRLAALLPKEEESGRKRRGAGGQGGCKNEQVQNTLAKADNTLSLPRVLDAVLEILEARLISHRTQSKGGEDKTKPSRRSMVTPGMRERVDDFIFNHFVHRHGNLKRAKAELKKFGASLMFLAAVHPRTFAFAHFCGLIPSSAPARGNRTWLPEDGFGHSCYRPYLMDNWYVPLIKAVIEPMTDQASGVPGIIKALGKGSQQVWVDKKQFNKAAFARLKYLRDKEHPAIVTFHQQLTSVHRSGKGKRIMVDFDAAVACMIPVWILEEKAAAIGLALVAARILQRWIRRGVKSKDYEIGKGRAAATASPDKSILHSKSADLDLNEIIEQSADREDADAESDEEEDRGLSNTLSSTGALTSGRAAMERLKNLPQISDNGSMEGLLL